MIGQRAPAGTAASSDAFAGALAAALDCTPGAATREQAQEVLDLLAVAAGTKRRAALLLGAQDEAWRGVLGAVLAAGPLATRTGPAWTVVGEFDGVADWYAEGVRAHRRTRRLIFAWLADASAGQTDVLCAGADVLPAVEAESLGYPPCCVGAQHARTRSFHRLMARLIERAAGPDRMRMQRLAQAEIVLPPADETERQVLAAALETWPAPFTSVNMCRACAGDSDSPAGRLSRAYEALAHRTGLHRRVAAAVGGVAGEGWR